MVRAVLFDLGDTLFNLETNDPRRFLEQGVGLAYDELAGNGVALPPRPRYLRKVVRAVGLRYLWSQRRLREIDLLRLIREKHRKWGITLDREAAEQYARTCHQPFRKIFNAAPGVHEMLRRVHAAGYTIGLVSNTFMLSQVMDEDLDAEGLLDYFACRIYSCDVGLMKPHPRIFEAALQRLGVPASETMFVGDLIDVDIKGAKRVGMTTVLKVADGRVPPGRYRPDHVIRRITEVPALLPRCRA
ncbi:MAG: HAD family hydrolase [Planctomycetota bacterium]|jgi:HAD superfamily hydrolase (TIGR01509 family)